MLLVLCSVSIVLLGQTNHEIAIKSVNRPLRPRSLVELPKVYLNTPLISISFDGMGSSRAPDGVAGGGRKRLCRAQAEGVRAVRCTAVFGRVLLFFLSVPVPSVCRCPGIAGNRVRNKDPFLPTPIGLHGGNRVLIVVGGLWVLPGVSVEGGA